MRLWAFMRSLILALALASGAGSAWAQSASGIDAITESTLQQLITALVQNNNTAYSSTNPGLALSCGYVLNQITFGNARYATLQCDTLGNLRQTSQVSSGSGGLAGVSRIPSAAASTNLTQAKATAGRLYKIVACNTTTTNYRIKFYNALSANVTVGTTVPVMSRPLPAAAAAGGLNCASYDVSDIGWYLSTAITYAIVAGAADSDATAPTAGAITDLSVEYQ